MMKIFKRVFLCLLAIFVVCSNFTASDKVSAVSEAERNASIQNQIKEELLSLVEYNRPAEEKQMQNRIPGSKGEYNAAIYLKTQLSELNNFKAVNNASTIDGVESFEFKSVYDDNMYTSQNVIFKRESLIDTNRKIILCAHYDAPYIEKEDTREKIDINELNKKIDEIVAREQVLRDEINKIISEIEV